MTSVPDRTVSAARRPAGWWLFAATAAAISIVMPWLSADYGITWDEPARFANGSLVVSFYRGELRAADFPDDGSRLYGGLFDVTACAVHQLAGGDVWVTRHRVNAAFGAIGIVATGLFAATLLTPSAGTLAMILMALSPRYLSCDEQPEGRSLCRALHGRAALVPASAARAAVSCPGREPS